MAPRSPYIYFGGVTVPIGIDILSGDMVYVYREWNESFDREFWQSKFSR